MCILFYAVIVPNIVNGKIALAIIFSLSLAAMALTTIISSYIDPSDSAMVHYRNNRA